MKTGRDLIDGLSFSDMSGGIATAYPGNAIARNQVADSLNVLFERRGFSKHKSLQGITADQIVSGFVRGWFVYKMQSGTEVYILVYNLKIYSVTLSDGTLTQIGTLTSDNECKAVNYFGCLWMVNGVDAVKIDSSLNVYRIGIAAPTAGTASATGTGTLPTGAYGIYISYARKVSGTIVLHSAPYYVGSVTPSGVQLIRIVVTASTDPQVTHIVAWMTDAGGSTYYYYGETTNASGNFDISSNSNRNANLLMYEQSAGNQLPGAIENIWVADGRLHGSINGSNIDYYTMKAQNVYDLERWPTEYYIPTIPFVIYSGYVLNGDYYVNTLGGMYRFGGSDLSVKPQSVIQGAMSNTSIIYFPKSMLGTVVEYNDVIWGVTNDGFRMFDGRQFSIDLSKHIKPTFDKVKNGVGDFNPASLIYRRSGKRTEYQLSYRDKDYAQNTNNRRLILNLDTIVIANNVDYTAAWEIANPGFTHAIVTADNSMYVVQSTSNGSVVATETGDATYRCYDENGVYQSTKTARTLKVKTRTYIGNLAGMSTWEKLYTLKTLNATCTIKLLLADKNNYGALNTLLRSGVNEVILDGATPVVIPFVLDYNYPAEQFVKCPQNAHGNTMAIEIEQTAEDDNFFFYEIEAYGYHERNNFT